jgi:ABC-type multidrug transport system ATPase subunit
LSGGERRRTEIARALAVDPKFILLDEPFAGVDPIAVEDIQAIVAKLKYRNIGILITDHNVNETLSICDRAYLLIDGKIFTHGTAQELANDEQVRRLYLGRNFELKRKDYLHDEAAVSSTPLLKNIIRSLESNIASIDNIVNEEKAASRSFGYKQKPITEYESFQQFSSSFSENFEFLDEFAKKNNLPEVKEKIDSLRSFDGTIDNLRSDLSTIVFYLKGYQDN